MPNMPSNPTRPAFLRRLRCFCVGEHDDDAEIVIIENDNAEIVIMENDDAETVIMENNDDAETVIIETDDDAETVIMDGGELVWDEGAESA